MITDKITISNNGAGINEALNLTEGFAEKLNLERKQRFHLRLLAEEMFSMIKTITGDFNAKFWIQEENHNCELHMEAKSKLDYQQRKELISVSTRGKNIAHRGIMDKIREIIEAGLHSFGESYDLQAEYGTGMFHYGTFDAGMSEAIYAWSLQKYKSDVEANQSDSFEEWDELEKSIIANVADEVKVGINKDSIELIVQKNFD